MDYSFTTGLITGALMVGLATVVAPWAAEKMDEYRWRKKLRKDFNMVWGVG